MVAAKPETKDTKTEEQKPKVPAPQWAGVGEPFRENFENSDPRANPSSTSLRQLQPRNQPELKGNPGTDQNL